MCYLCFRTSIPPHRTSYIIVAYGKNGTGGALFQVGYLSVIDFFSLYTFVPPGFVPRTSPTAVSTYSLFRAGNYTRTKTRDTVRVALVAQGKGSE